MDFIPYRCREFFRQKDFFLLLLFIYLVCSIVVWKLFPRKAKQNFLLFVFSILLLSGKEKYPNKSAVQATVINILKEFFTNIFLAVCASLIVFKILEICAWKFSALRNKGKITLLRENVQQINFDLRRVLKFLFFRYLWNIFRQKYLGKCIVGEYLDCNVGLYCI